MRRMINTLYGGLYTSKGVSEVEILLNSVPCKVTVNMNDFVLNPYLEEEVKMLFFKSSNKGSRPHGFLMHFSEALRFMWR